MPAPAGRQWCTINNSVAASNCLFLSRRSEQQSGLTRSAPPSGAVNCIRPPCPPRGEVNNNCNNRLTDAPAPNPQPAEPSGHLGLLPPPGHRALHDRAAQDRRVDVPRKAIHSVLGSVSVLPLGRRFSRKSSSRERGTRDSVLWSLGRSGVSSFMPRCPVLLFLSSCPPLLSYPWPPCSFLLSPASGVWVGSPLHSSGRKQVDPWSARCGQGPWSCRPRGRPS
jgi:hypothetical protein